MLVVAVAQPQTPRDSLAKRIDALFADVDNTASPGCALGVIRDGALVYARGYGMANLDESIALSPSSAFYIASTSKQFTAASILLLAADGKLSLDDDVRKYIPELPDYGTPITIRNLVNHTSGIRDYLGLLGLGAGRAENVMSDDEIIALIARQKSLNFKPGSEYSYSNSGYFLLGQIVKRVTGTSLAAYAESRIFRPLGMIHTQFHDDRLKTIPHRVIGYAQQNESQRSGATSGRRFPRVRAYAAERRSHAGLLRRHARGRHTRGAGGRLPQHAVGARDARRGRERTPNGYGLWNTSSPDGS